MQKTCSVSDIQHNRDFVVVQDSSDDKINIHFNELVNRLKPAVWGTFKILNNQGGAVKLPVGKKTRAFDSRVCLSLTPFFEVAPQAAGRLQLTAQIKNTRDLTPS